MVRSLVGRFFCTFLAPFYLQLIFSIFYHFSNTQISGYSNGFSSFFKKRKKNCSSSIINNFYAKLYPKETFGYFPEQDDINLYSNSVDYFLFDYKSKKYGGSGKSFDWSILNKIKISKPFFLSGGISLENINKIASLYDNRFLHAVDINSKFEKYPGFKDVKLIDKFYNLNL